MGHMKTVDWYHKQLTGSNPAHRKQGAEMVGKAIRDDARLALPLLTGRLTQEQDPDVLSALLSAIGRILQNHPTLVQIIRGALPTIERFLVYSAQAVRQSVEYCIKQVSQALGEYSVVTEQKLTLTIEVKKRVVYHTRRAMEGRMRRGRPEVVDMGVK